MSRLFLFAVLVSVAAIGLSAPGAVGRVLMASDAGTEPQECSGTFTEEWKPDHIECHVCPDNAQLKCEVKGSSVRDAYAACEYDPGVLSEGIDFQCAVTEDNQVSCNWQRLKSILPSDNDDCAYYATYAIFQNWIPSLS